MNSLLQATLGHVVTNYPLHSSSRDKIIRASKITASLLAPLEKRQITFELHPLQTLYHLLQHTRDYATLNNALYAVPRKLRNTLFYEVWSQGTNKVKKDSKWGERNALVHLARLLNVIQTVVEKRLDDLPFEKKRAVCATAFRMAGQPETWDDGNIKDDTPRLIRALHRNQGLDIPGTEIRVYSDLERNLSSPSTTFHLHRRELERGQICLLNGLNNTLEHAWDSARRHSEESAQGYNLHCVYSATVDTKWDVASGLICEGGTATPAVYQLLNLWQDYFETDENHRLLQICHSRGAIEVNRALNLLPEHLRERIIVVTLAPACLIPPDKAYKVRNFAILSDPIVQIAANPEHLESNHTTILEPHTDTTKVHSAHGSSYRAVLGPLINTYINTNDI